MLHYIDTPFTVEGVTITKGYYTKASYWFKRPYNIYRWFEVQQLTELTYSLLKIKL